MSLLTFATVQWEQLTQLGKFKVLSTNINYH